ncbi:chromosome condensation membrane protein [Achromobacter xylosoxidans]|uniref:fluoride efflux transporter CrcB n=1 Tax=Alcaligenes xylosoxydans xylosoxydans TaxID=85698 RepID=UPI0006BFB6DF|nr:fluoride efflux transporter CrcB [Achromobacter xylosoxidans]CUJ03221.1 chromosome condensation membrane protein [Achromobacter xylosoxidans]CUJ19635.1 chromosome condensation membrane protein [Achromobacter xylosoxidans]
MVVTVFAISIGAALGALLRWWLGNAFNSLFPSIPPGTLIANLLGGYIIGLAISYFGGHPGLSPQWRLFIVTGFCGGLTTFSTFSGELASLVQQERFGLLAASITAHVAGSLVMTLLGIATISAMRPAN